ncbi:hypothetical protein E2C01_095425 [Portunus trituberculatus]|uniref:Uncharacterized protein n=1 Tax=Portunus trituberculatus TaxID=210409 RepID=A0A5B7K468_PORTR|nr:hypothetical protein [Portunus trituberculatus]
MPSLSQRPDTPPAHLPPPSPFNGTPHPQNSSLQASKDAEVSRKTQTVFFFACESLSVPPTPAADKGRHEELLTGLKIPEGPLDSLQELRATTTTTTTTTASNTAITTINTIKTQH